MRYSTTEFEILYVQYFPSAMRTAISLLHDEDEARDAVQEVFLRLWESKASTDNPMAFIVRSVRNTCLNRINMLDTREKIRQKISLEPILDEFDLESRNEDVMNAIKLLLTPRERETVENVFCEGMSYKKTAEILEVSVAAVNKNIVSALKKLRHHFKTNK